MLRFSSRNVIIFLHNTSFQYVPVVNLDYRKRTISAKVDSTNCEKVGRDIVGSISG